MTLFLLLAVRLPHYGFLETPVGRQYPPHSDQKNVLSAIPGTCASNEGSHGGRYTHYDHRHFDNNREKCTYRSYYGLCRFLTMEYENDSDNALKVEVQFIPKMRRMRQADLIKQFKVKGDFPTQKWVEDRHLAPGVEVFCTHHLLHDTSQRYCYEEHFELHGIDVEGDDE